MEEDNDYSKSYYRIRDVADFIGVSQSTLRFWEREFPADVKTIRNAGNTRFYPPSTIETLKIIRYLLHDRGMRIEAVKRELQQNRKNLSRRMQILEQLQSVRTELKSILSALNKRKM